MEHLDKKTGDILARYVRVVFVEVLCACSIKPGVPMDRPPRSANELTHPKNTKHKQQNHHSVATTRKEEATAVLRVAYRIAAHPAEFGASTQH